MNLTIVGASAGVGLKCVERALERGHRVTTLSRSINSINQHPNLHSVKGSATSADDLQQVLKDADAVIVALGTGKNTKATKLYTDFAAALLNAQEVLSTKAPFIILTGFGAGDSRSYQGLLMKLVFATLLKAVYKNKTEMEALLSKSPINWEFVRPGVLNDKPLSEKYKVQTEYFKGMKVGSISRADLADFMIKQAENPTHLGKYPALSNK